MPRARTGLLPGSRVDRHTTARSAECCSSLRKKTPGVISTCITRKLHPVSYPPPNDGSRMSLIVRSPGAADRIAGIEFTVIEAVAMSPCTPPSIFE